MVVVVNHYYVDVCVTCAKGSLDSNFNSAVIEKISIFTKLPQISHTHNNCNLKSIIGPF